MLLTLAGCQGGWCCFSFPKVLVELLLHFDSFSQQRILRTSTGGRLHQRRKLWSGSLPLSYFCKTVCFTCFFFKVQPQNKHVDLLYGLSLLLGEDCALSLSFSESALQRRETAFLFVVIVSAAANAAAAEPSNLMLRYHTLFRHGPDGDTDVDYCFWEVSLAAPTRTHPLPHPRPPPPTTISRLQSITGK